jgi:hypothetical protein
MTTPAAAPAAADLTAGMLGPLTDADLARETAQLTDLHNRQRLDAPSAGANPTPRTLLSLFGDA